MRPPEVTFAIHSDSRRRYPDGMPATAPVTPERRRFAVRLPRQVWIGVAMVSAGTVVVAVLWLRGEFQRAEVQRNVVAEIRTREMDVKYDWGWDWSKNSSVDAGRFRRLIGPDLFAHVTIVHAARLDDETAELVTHLEGVKEIDVPWSSQITDAGMEWIGQINSLENLDLCAPRVTDVGLLHLNRLGRLRYLKLTCAEISDAGLARIGDMVSLGVLVLGMRAQISDDGLMSLGRAKALWAANIPSESISKGGIERLKAIRPDLEVTHYIAP